MTKPGYSGSEGRDFNDEEGIEEDEDDVVA
jgi:hypothetical protein